MTAEIQVAIEEMRAKLARDTPPYKDHSKELKLIVETLGGIDAVLSDEAKMNQVVQSLSTGHTLTLAVSGRGMHVPAAASRHARARPCGTRATLHCRVLRRC